MWPATRTTAQFGQSFKSLLFDDLLPQAAEKELILFSFSDAWRNRLDELLRDKGVIRIHRKVFTFNPDKFSAHKDWRDRIPDGFCMRQIDEQLAERQPAYRPIVASSKKFGFCLLKEEQVVSECVSIFVGKGEAEIDIHTHEEYRGRGLATLTASAFIEACLSRGLRPNWACWPERRASWAWPGNWDSKTSRMFQPTIGRQTCRRELTCHLRAWAGRTEP